MKRSSLMISYAVLFAALVLAVIEVMEGLGGFSSIALAQNPFESELAKATVTSSNIVNTFGAWGVGITGAIAVVTTVLPFRFLESWKNKSYGALALVIVLFFGMKMFPSVGKALEDIKTCPVSAFGLKC